MNLQTRDLWQPLTILTIKLKVQVKWTTAHEICHICPLLVHHLMPSNLLYYFCHIVHKIHVQNWFLPPHSFHKLFKYLQQFVCHSLDVDYGTTWIHDTLLLKLCNIRVFPKHFPYCFFHSSSAHAMHNKQQRLGSPGCKLHVQLLQGLLNSLSSQV